LVTCEFTITLPPLDCDTFDSYESLIETTADALGIDSLQVTVINGSLCTNETITLLVNVTGSEVEAVEDTAEWIAEFNNLAGSLLSSYNVVVEFAGGDAGCSSFLASPSPSSGSTGTTESGGSCLNVWILAIGKLFI